MKKYLGKKLEKKSLEKITTNIKENKPPIEDF